MEPIEKFAAEFVTLVRVMRRRIREENSQVLSPETARDMLVPSIMVSKGDPTGVFAYCGRKLAEGNTDPPFADFLFFAYQLAARDCSPEMETMLERTEPVIKEELCVFFEMPKEE